MFEQRRKKEYSMNMIRLRAAGRRQGGPFAGDATVAFEFYNDYHNRFSSAPRTHPKRREFDVFES